MKENHNRDIICDFKKTIPNKSSKKLVNSKNSKVHLEGAIIVKLPKTTEMNILIFPINTQ